MHCSKRDCVSLMKIIDLYMKKLLFALLCIFAFSLNAQEISIIPKPAEMHAGEGHFLFRS